MRTNTLRKLTTCLSMLAGAALISTLATPALADPLPNEVLKFEQLPLNNGVAPSAGGAPFFGHDERSTAYVNTAGTYNGSYVADDFSDLVSRPVVHVQWWGSYANNVVNNGINQFMISFANDVPALNGQPSHPTPFISSQVVTLTPGPLTPASGNFTEKLINAATPGDHLYQYNAELSLPFAEQANQVYWLSVVALSNDPAIGWGWHNRDYGLTNGLFAPVSPGETNIGNAAFPVFHFQDDAVVGGIANNLPVPGFGALFYSQNGDDGPVGFGPFSEDMAFRLFTTPVPEPSTLALGGIGLASFATWAYRRRKGKSRLAMAQQ